MNVLVFGDSIASGYWDTDGGWRGFLGRELHQRTVESEGEKWFEVYDLGFGGDTSEDLNKRIKNETEGRVGEHLVKLIIQIGINDSQYNNQIGQNKVSEEDFRENLEEIIEKTSEIADEVTLLGLTPVNEEIVDPMPWNNDYSYLNSNIKVYEQIISEVSRDKNIGFIPLFDQLDDEEWRETLWDGVHPDKEGHKRIYEVVAPELNL